MIECDGTCRLSSTGLRCIPVEGDTEAEPKELLEPSQHSVKCIKDLLAENLIFLGEQQELKTLYVLYF